MVSAPVSATSTAMWASLRLLLLARNAQHVERLLTGEPVLVHQDAHRRFHGTCSALLRFSARLDAMRSDRARAPWVARISAMPTAAWSKASDASE